MRRAANAEAFQNLYGQLEHYVVHPDYRQLALER